MSHPSKSCPTAVPVRVEARLQQGIVADSMWPQLLDGLLAGIWTRTSPAFQSWRRGGALYNPRLPLRTRKTGHRWVWRASCCRPVGASVEDLHWWHKRGPDRGAASAVTDGRQARNVGSVGPMRAYRAPLPVTAAAAVEWHAWADPDLLRPMLDDVWSIGRKRSQGEGAVLAWTVDTATPDDPELWGLWWPDTATAARPMFAPQSAPDGLCTVAGVRPPYWHPDRQHRVWAPHVTVDEVREVCGVADGEPPPLAG